MNYFRVTGLTAALSAVIVIASAISIYLVCYTQSGTRLAVTWLVDQQTQVTLGGVSGSLGNGMHLSEVRVITPVADISVQSASIEISLGALFSRRIQVDGLIIAGLAIKLTPGPESQDPPTHFRMPVQLVVQRATIQDIDLQSGDTRIFLDNLNISATLIDDSLTVSEYSLTAYDQLLQGEVGLTLNHPFEHQGSARLGTQRGEVTGKYAGDINGLEGHIDALIPEPVSVEWQVRFTTPLGFELSATADELESSGILVQSPRLSVIGSMDDYSVTGNANVSVAGRPATTMKLAGRGNQDALAVHEILWRDDVASIDGNARLNWAVGEWTANLAADYAGRTATAQVDLKGSTPRTLSGHANLSLGQGNQLRVQINPRGRQLEVKLTDLATLIPGLTGHIRGLVTQADDGSINGNLTSSLLTFEDWRARKTSLDFTGTLDQVKAQLGVTALARDESVFGDATLNYLGDLDQGDVKVKWVHPQAGATLSGKLQRDSQAIQLNVASARITGDLDASSDPSTIVYREGVISATDHCWQINSNSVCFNGLNASASFGGLSFESNDVETSTFSATSASGQVMYQSGPALDVRLTAEVAQLTVGSVIADGSIIASGPPENLGFALTTKGSIAGSGFELTSNGRASLNSVVTDQLKLTSERFDLAGSVSLQMPQDANANLRGTVNDQSFNASARLSWPDFSIDQLDSLTTEGSVVLADNRVHWETPTPGQLFATLNAPNLSEVDARLKGDVTASLDADLSHLHYSAQASSARLAFNAFEATGVELILGGRGTLPISVNMEVGNSWINDVSLGRGNIELQSNRATIDWQHPTGRLAIATQFRRDGTELDGYFSNGLLTLGEQRWKLDTTPSFKFSPESILIEAHCWRFETASFCSERTRLTPQTANIKLRLDNASLNLASPVLTSDVSINGVITGKLNFSASNLDDGQYVLNAQIDLPATLTYFEDQQMPWSMSAKIDLKNHKGRAEINAASDAANHLNARIQTIDLNQPTSGSGELKLRSNKLELISALAPQLDQANGNASVDAAISWLDQEFKGNVTAAIGPDATMAIPAAGISLRGTSLTLAGDLQAMDIHFEADSGNGHLEAIGQFKRPLMADAELDLSVTGSGFETLGREDLALVLSPDIDLRWRSGSELGIKGQLTVDSGSLKIAALQSSPRSPSADVVVISREKPSAPTPIALDLNLRLNDFALDTYGLKGDAYGELQLSQVPGETRRATGNLQLRDGTFSRYGQDFIIDQGRLTFVGPLTNPNVDVISTRTIEEDGREINASLTLSGPVNNIRSSVSASPQMSEANALSYLITGRPLRSADSADANMIGGAAISLGLRQVAPITREIQNTLGLSELTIESEGLDSTTVIAGKQLNPKLYVEYSYDVLASIGGIAFNYELTDNFSLETRTGEANSLRLIYTLQQGAKPSASAENEGPGD